MTQRHRRTTGVVVGLCLGMLILFLAMIAARDGRIGWDVAQAMTLAPVGLALLFGIVAGARS